MKPQLVLALLGLIAGSHAGEVMDLSGEWRFMLDVRNPGVETRPEDVRFSDRIQLPGTVTGQGFGEKPSFRTKWTGEGWRYPELFKEWQGDGNFKIPFFLQPPRHYVGPAWFQRTIVIPDDWKGGFPEVMLERVHWRSCLWVDDRRIGECDSLGTPHVFDLGRLQPGAHTLTLCIDNSLAPVNVGPLSHSVTDHTQGNWNGVVGRMELRRRYDDRIDRVRATAMPDGTLKVNVAGRLADYEGEAPFVEVRDDDLILVAGEHPVRKEDGSFQIELVGKLKKAPMSWNEFEPKLYHFSVSLFRGDDYPADRKTLTVGFREVGAKDGRITVNGRKIFLRGTLECCIFPLTGHPPTDVESWKRIVGICKAHGLNHIRFHSWCPPEAAFVAADELGFYYQVEVSSWANQGAEIGSGKPLDTWLEAESKRMLDAYGNHPSFLMMAYGNEPAGKNHARWLQDWVARRKAEDPRRLYTTASGWPIMPGCDFHSSPDPRIQRWGEGIRSIINSQAPSTDFDWSAFVKQHSGAPVISHEIGQWCAYPNFSEIDKYTGYFKAANFEIFRETARRNGLLNQAGDFLKASGRLQVLAYKHDIEAALRTPGFGGFQLLDLHDFPGQGTALVGVLDAFWDGKGYVKPSEYRRFCGPVVPLARLKKMIYQEGEALECRLQFAQFGPRDLKQAAALWRLVAADGSLVGQGEIAPRDYATGELHELGAIRVPLDDVGVPGKLTLTVRVKDTEAINSWDVFVYPKPTDAGHRDGRVVRTDNLDEAKAALAEGRKVLWTPPVGSIRDDPDRPLTAGFSPIFWNTAWTNWQPPHTLGILCDPKHPALAAFPTEFHSNWQWWGIQHRARPFILIGHKELKPIVQVIDDWVTNRKLGYLFEAKVGHGAMLACGVEETDSPESRQFFTSIRNYVESDRFAPAFEMKPADLDSLVVLPPMIVSRGGRAVADSQEPGYEAGMAMDGNPATLWHTAFSGAKPDLPHEWKVTLRESSRMAAVVLSQRQDRNANGQVAEAEILVDGRVVATLKMPRDVLGFRVPLPAGLRADNLAVRVLKSHAGPFACLAEVDIEESAVK